jgi:hypothetical protein
LSNQDCSDTYSDCPFSLIDVFLGIHQNEWSWLWKYYLIRIWKHLYLHWIWTTYKILRLNSFRGFHILTPKSIFTTPACVRNSLDGKFSLSCKSDRKFIIIISFMIIVILDITLCGVAETDNV